MDSNQISISDHYQNMLSRSALIWDISELWNRSSYMRYLRFSQRHLNYVLGVYKNRCDTIFLSWLDVKNYISKNSIWSIIMHNSLFFMSLTLTDSFDAKLSWTILEFLRNKIVWKTLWFLVAILLPSKITFHITCQKQDVIASKWYTSHKSKMSRNYRNYCRKIL